MFRTPAADIAEPTRDDSSHLEPLVPLSVIQLDLDQPSEGWVAALSAKGVPIVEDDLGRRCVSRGDAKRVFTEHRQAEEVKAEMRARQEREAIESDQRFRAQLGAGVPASAIPAGLSYAEAVVVAELDAQSYRPRRTSVVEDLLSNDGITFHSLAEHDADEP